MRLTILGFLIRFFLIASPIFVVAMDSSDSHVVVTTSPLCQAFVGVRLPAWRESGLSFNPFRDAGSSATSEHTVLSCGEEFLPDDSMHLRVARDLCLTFFKDIGNMYRVLFQEFRSLLLPHSSCGVSLDVSKSRQMCIQLNRLMRKVSLIKHEYLEYSEEKILLEYIEKELLVALNVWLLVSLTRSIIASVDLLTVFKQSVTSEAGGFGRGMDGESIKDFYRCLDGTIVKVRKIADACSSLGWMIDDCSSAENSCKMLLTSMCDVYTKYYERVQFLSGANGGDISPEDAHFWYNVGNELFMHLSTMQSFLSLINESLNGVFVSVDTLLDDINRDYGRDLQEIRAEKMRLVQVGVADKKKKVGESYLKEVGKIEEDEELRAYGDVIHFLLIRHPELADTHKGWEQFRILRS